MSTIHDMNFLKEKVQELKAQGLYKVPVTLEGPNEAECIIDGRKVINLSSNNYLGFSNHPRLKKAAIAAIETYGAGAGAVRPIIGNMKIHIVVLQFVMDVEWGIVAGIILFRV